MFQTKNRPLIKKISYACHTAERVTNATNYRTQQNLGDTDEHFQKENCQLYMAAGRKYSLRCIVHPKETRIMALHVWCKQLKCFCLMV